VSITTTARTVSGWNVLEVAGALDMDGAPQLRLALLDLIDGDSPLVIVDVEAVDFIDSVGLGALVSALKRTRTAGGELRLVGVKSHMERVLRVTGLHRVFGVHDSIDAAVHAPLSPPDQG